MSCILDIKNLNVEIFTELGIVRAVRGVDLSLDKGQVLAIVGESGCGKTMLCRSIQGILPKNARVTNGEIALPLKKDNEKVINYISMIFQNPMSALNPTMKIGDQIREGIINKKHISKREAKKEAIKFMELVGIEGAKERYSSMPHEFSGGMRQRIVIAIALCTQPDILIADEPTTALDVTIQKQILNLILDLKDKMGISIIFITHDLSIVANIADKVAVMYAGKIIEFGTTEEIFEDARHPYTKALINALPTDDCNIELKSLIGCPPSLINIPKGDLFAKRNKNALKIDFYEEPPMFKITDTHKAATWTLNSLYEEIYNSKLNEEISISINEVNHG
ncbi:MAG: ABC transporter ATP-binding protein [Sarcina sp.]